MPGAPCILIIEDDRPFAEVMLGVIRSEGLRGIVAGDARTALALAAEHRPRGIVLDIGLPDIDGWTVMEALRRAPETRDIPVHLITASDDARRAARLGAVGMPTKPVELAQVRGALRALERAARRGVRRVLVVDSDAPRMAALRGVLEHNQLEVDGVAGRREALAKLVLESYGCVVANISDVDSGLELVAGMRGAERSEATPIVIDAHGELAPADVERLERAGATVVAAGQRSEERVLAETRAFVHRVVTARAAASTCHPPPRRCARRTDCGQDRVDRRRRHAQRLLALGRARRRRSSRVLDRRRRTGSARRARRTPRDRSRVDGRDDAARWTATRRRGRSARRPRFARLPIIALTAKTMPGEREKCIEAGANDYVPKPVDVGRLIAAAARLARLAHPALPDRVIDPREPLDRRCIADRADQDQRDEKSRT